VSGPRAQWIPRAADNNGRGDLLRQSFEDRLEQRVDEAPMAELFERLRVAELERREALTAIGELPPDVRRVLARVLGLPADAQAALTALL
jgi:hypothetical protein